MSVQSDLQQLANPEKAQFLSRFFKTAPGQYGHGDIFLGITVPMQRAVAKNYQHLPLDEIKKLIHSPVHEHRLTGLIILAWKFEKKSQEEQKKIYDFYLSNATHVNNWDLVDSSAHIVGYYLIAHPQEKKILTTLAQSKNLWERRISIVGTQVLIKQKDFDMTFTVARLLLHDTHDLIHKAVGWMLREVGKQDVEAEESFLKEHYKIMPRTMLRYAIEHFPTEKRAWYMKT
jgi:3-methyladenine DNA glycosylase AlkD